MTPPLRPREVIAGPSWDLLEAAPDATIVVDAQGRIAFANAQAERLFGHPRSELTGEPLEMLIAARHRQRHAEHFAKFLAAPSAHPVETRLDLFGLRRDGQEFPIEIASSPIRIVDRAMVIAVVRDITARLATEAALRERERQLSTIYDTVSDVIFQLAVENGGRYRFVSVNPKFYSVTGLRAEQVVGKNVDEVIPEPSLARVHEKYAEAIRERRSVRWEEVSEYPNGELTGEVCITPMFDAAGECTHLIGSVHDVTRIASDRMAAVGTLAAGVAHEINNPLAVVIGNLDVAFRDVSDQTERLGLSRDLRDQLRDARDCAERIRTIVRDLNVFSRAEEDRRAPVDTESVLESTLRMASNEIRHRARLVKQYGKVPAVEANESRLGQVFLNLIVNAAHAIPEGKAEVNEIRVSTRLDRIGNVVVEIADTGCGMSPEVQRRIFTPFFTTKPVGVGTGLGLSICHRIVTRLGGRIEVESEIGKGSAFRIHLPRARSEEARTAEPAAAVPVARRRGRIMVIDDEPALGTTLRMVLAADSVEDEVITTTRAQKALDRIAAGERFDVILCDLMMPDVTGMDFYDQLTRSAPEQAERVIFMTGGAFTARAREFLDRVPNVRIDKPFDPQQLRALVNDRIR